MPKNDVAERITVLLNVWLVFQHFKLLLIAFARQRVPTLMLTMNATQMPGGM